MKVGCDGFLLGLVMRRPPSTAFVNYLSLLFYVVETHAVPLHGMVWHGYLLFGKTSHVVHCLSFCQRPSGPLCSPLPPPVTMSWQVHWHSVWKGRREEQSLKQPVGSKQTHIFVRLTSVKTLNLGEKNKKCVFFIHQKQKLKSLYVCAIRCN